MDLVDDENENSIFTILLFIIFFVNFLVDKLGNLHNRWNYFLNCAHFIKHQTTDCLFVSLKKLQYRGGSELLVEAGDQRRVIPLPPEIQGKVAGAKFGDRSLVISLLWPLYFNFLIFYLKWLLITINVSVEAILLSPQFWMTCFHQWLCKGTRIAHYCELHINVIYIWRMPVLVYAGVGNMWFLFLFPLLWNLHPTTRSN